MTPPPTPSTTTAGQAMAYSAPSQNPKAKTLLPGPPHNDSDSSWSGHCTLQISCMTYLAWMQSWMLVVQTPVANSNSSKVRKCIGTANNSRQYGIACNSTHTACTSEKCNAVGNGSSTTMTNTHCLQDGLESNIQYIVCITLNDVVLVAVWSKFVCSTTLHAHCCTITQ